MCPAQRTELAPIKNKILIEQNSIEEHNQPDPIKGPGSELIVL